MTDRNSAAADRMTPEEAMTFLGIKSSAYYDRLNYLGEKLEKAEDNKKYLSQVQIQRLGKLDSWIKEKGKMDGFIEQEGQEGRTALAIADDTTLMADIPAVDAGAQVDDENGGMEHLIRMAAQLKAQQLAVPLEIVRAIASQMTEDDLPDDLKAMVQGSRDALSPKIQPAQVAANLLDQWRSNRSGAAVAAA
jgi:hypothetical protein